MPNINSHLQYLIKSFEQIFVKGQQWVDSIQLVVNEHLLERQQTKSIDNLPAWYPKKYLKKASRSQTTEKWSEAYGTFIKNYGSKLISLKIYEFLFALRQHTTCLRKHNVLFISFLNITQTLASRNHQLEMVQVKGVGLRNFPRCFRHFFRFPWGGKTTTQKTRKPVHGIQGECRKSNSSIFCYKMSWFVNILDVKWDKCVKSNYMHFSISGLQSWILMNLILRKVYQNVRLLISWFLYFSHMILEASNHR